MPGSFRHPPFRALDSREFAARWTPEQVRGDGIVTGGICQRAIGSSIALACAAEWKTLTVALR
jgi:hypothetical protein